MCSGVSSNKTDDTQTESQNMKAIFEGKSKMPEQFDETTMNPFEIYMVMSIQKLMEAQLVLQYKLDKVLKSKDDNISDIVSIYQILSIQTYI